MENIINRGLKMNHKMENLKKIFPEAKDFLPLLGTDYVEFYVGKSKLQQQTGFGQILLIRKLFP